MIKVLFLCVHNSARSQMAEAFLNKHGGDRFEVESAGLEPGKLNPYVVRAMAEAAIDISRNATKSVFDLAKAGRRYDVVVTVCSKRPPSAARSSPDSTRSCTGPSPILPPSRGATRRSWQRSGKFAIRSSLLSKSSSPLIPTRAMVLNKGMRNRGRGRRALAISASSVLLRVATMYCEYDSRLIKQRIKPN